MKTLFAMGLSVFTLTSGIALAEPGKECASDADCGKGEICYSAPCAAMACDSDDANCDPPECPDTMLCRTVDEEEWKPESECQTDADCGDGFLCQVLGMGGSSGCACASDPDGEVPADCTCPPAPEPVEYKGCVAKPCEKDADCGEGMECATYEVGCATAAMPCASGEDCNQPAPPCESSTYTQCQYKWEGTCESDADCGGGFACKAYESCTCSGGTSTPSADGGSSGGGSSGDSGSGGGGAAFAPPPEEEEGDADSEEDCSCAPSDEKYCEILEVECEADSDCAPGLVCGGGWSDGGVSTMPVECDSESGECSEEKMPAPAPDEPTDDGPKMCSPQYRTFTGVPGGVEEDGTTADGKGESNNPDAPSDGGANGDDTSAPATEGPGLGSDNDGAAGSSKNTEAAGCTVTTTASASPWAMLLLGLLAVFRMRRSAR